MSSLRSMRRALGRVATLVRRVPLQPIAPLIRRAVVVAIVLGAACATGAHAHDLYTSGTIIEQRGDSLHVSIEFHAGDLGRVFGLDRNGDESIDSSEALGSPDTLETMIDFLGEKLDIGWTAGEEESPAVPIDAPSTPEWDYDLAGNPTVRFQYAFFEPDTVTAITYRFDVFEDFGEQFLNIGIVMTPALREQFLLTIENPSVTVPAPPRGGGGEGAGGAGAAGAGHRFQTGFPAFVKLGVEHIFEGIDHILFLFALILVGGRFWSLIKIVTAFTVAHSVTLALAALDVVSLPPALVESAIALSIAYVAVENFRIESSERRWIVTGLFGFVHGFGFANVLRDIGLPRDALVSSLFGFNVGVELGQVVIVLVMFPAVLLIARSPWRRSIVWSLSAVLFVIALAWFLERAFGLPVGIL